MESKKIKEEKTLKVDKTPKAGVADMEEIKIRLSSLESELQQTEADLKDRTEESYQLKKDIEKLQNINQKILHEIETLKKSIQLPEEVPSKQLEAEASEKIPEAPKPEQRAADLQTISPERTISEPQESISGSKEKHFLDVAQTEFPVTEDIPESKKLIKPEETPEHRTAAVNTVIPERKLEILNLQVFQRPGNEISALSLSTGAGFGVRTIFRLSGTGALMLTKNRAVFQVTWFIKNLTEGGAALLKTSKGQLANNCLDYTVEEELPAPVPGLYQLTNVVTFPTIRNLIAHYEGPVIRVK